MRVLPEPNPITPGNCDCGGQAWLRKRKKLSGSSFFVECEACGKEGSTGYDGPEAVDYWNEEQAAREPSKKP